MWEAILMVAGFLESMLHLRNMIIWWDHWWYGPPPPSSQHGWRPDDLAYYYPDWPDDDE